MAEQWTRPPEGMIRVVEGGQERLVPASVIPAPTRPAVKEIVQAANSLALPVTQGEIDGTALRAMETVSERSTPVQRALSVGILAGILVVMGIIVCFVLWLAGAPGSAMLVLFAVVVVVAVVVAYLDGNRFSPTGVERYKAGQYTKIRLSEIASQERIVLAKLNVYERILERVYGSDDPEQ